MLVEDVKLVAETKEQPITEYVTFWGKIKGTISKQEDLMSIINGIKKNINDINDKLLKKQDNLKATGRIIIEDDSEGNLTITDDGFINEVDSDLNELEGVVTGHIEDTVMHVTQSEKDHWDAGLINNIVGGDGIKVEFNSEGKLVISLRED